MIVSHRVARGDILNSWLSVNVSAAAAATQNSPIGDPKVFENMKIHRFKNPRNKHCLTAPHLCYGAVIGAKTVIGKTWNFV